jgi:N-acetylglucosamine malate deacetylase 1
MSTVLVVCAHPDDEAVGCGGTLRRHALDGEEIVAVFLTCGEGGGHGEADHGETRLAELIDSLRPALVYAPQPDDDHPDHRAAAKLVRRAVAASTARPAVRFFEIWSPLGDMDEIVDISDVIADKRSAIRAYRSQCAVMRLDEAFVGLARYRGEMHSWPGGAYAEVFRSG